MKGWLGASGFTTAIWLLIGLVGFVLTDRSEEIVCRDLFTSIGVVQVHLPHPINIKINLKIQPWKLNDRILISGNERLIEIRSGDSISLSPGNFIFLINSHSRTHCDLYANKDLMLNISCFEPTDRGAEYVGDYVFALESNGQTGHHNEIIKVEKVLSNIRSDILFCVDNETSEVLALMTQASGEKIVQSSDSISKFDDAYEVYDRQKGCSPVNVPEKAANEGTGFTDVNLRSKEGLELKNYGTSSIFRINQKCFKRTDIDGLLDGLIPFKSMDFDYGERLKEKKIEGEQHALKANIRNIGDETISNSKTYQETLTFKRTSVITDSSAYKETETLKKTSIITQSNTYMETETKEKSDVYTQSNTYKETETIQNTPVATQSNTYMETETKEKSDVYTQSSTYKETETLQNTPVASQSNTYMETETKEKSNIYTQSNTYKETETLQNTPIATQSDTYMETETKEKSNIYTQSNTYKETETIQNTPVATQSNTYMETETKEKSDVYTQSSTYKETETLQNTPVATQSNTYMETETKEKSNIYTQSSTYKETETLQRTATMTNTDVAPGAPQTISVSPASGGIGGGIVVTVSGLNFGTPNSNRLVTIGIKECLNPQFIGSTSVICTTPTSNEVGSFQVRVLVDGMEGTTEANFHYVPPIISDITPRVLPVDSSDPSNRMVTITGQNLFSSDPTYTHSILVGIEECKSIRFLSDDRFTCTASAGVGKNNIVRLKINLIEAITSNGAPITIDRTPPTISFISPSSGLISGGYNLTLVGHSFGYSILGGEFRLTIGDQIIPPTNILHRSNFAIIVKAPMGLEVGNFPFVVDVAGQSSSSVLDIFSYKPEIYFIEPNFGQSGGGTTITFHGPSFLNDTRAFVGDVPCTQLYITDTTKFNCTAPPGHGRLVNVYVSAGNLQSPTYSIWTYKEPVIDSIYPSEGAAVGGTIVTIYGMYLGSISATPTIVTINGISSKLLFQNETVLIISTPAGLGHSLPLVVNTGTSSSEAVSWSYLPPEITAYVSPQRSTLTGLVPVSITGKNFGTYKFDQNAMIDDVLCLPTIWINDSLLLCYAPPRKHPSSSLNVTVSVAGSKSLVNSYSKFEYFSTGIISIQPSSGPITGDHEVTIVTEDETSEFLTCIFVDINGKSLTKNAYRQSKNIYVIKIPVLLTINQFSIGDASVSIRSIKRVYPVEPYYFYGPVKASSIQPSRGYYQESSQITIYGIGFAPRLCSIMNLYFSPSDVKSDFTYASENMLYAFTPKTHVPGKFYVILKLGEKVLDSPIYYSFYTNPISIVSAQYNNDFTRIAVQFEKETNKGEFLPGKTKCSRFLDNSTLSIIGESPTCLWSDYMTLLIYPSSYPRIGSKITLANGTIVAKSKFDESRDIYPSSSGSVILYENDEKSHPVTLVAGSTFGRCSPLLLDASYSSGGKSFLQFQWEFLYSDPYYDLFELSALISTQTKSMINILPQENEIINRLPFSTKYNFRVTVTNAHGLSSSATVMTTRLDIDLPALSVSGPLINSITSDLPLTFTANMLPSMCSNIEIYSPKFFWTLSTSMIGSLSDYNVTDSGRRQRKLNFKEYAFQNSTYDEIQLGILITDADSQEKVSYYFNFTIIETPYKVTVIGANRTTGTGDTVKLTAELVSHRYDKPDLWYKWTCVDSSGSSCGIVLLEESTLVIEGNSLIPGTYYFSVTVSSIHKNGTGFAFLKYQSGNAPASIISVSPSIESIIAESYIYISSNTYSNEKESSFSYSWSSVDGYLDLTSDSVVMKSDGCGFIILPNQLQPHVSYQFALKTTDQNGNSGYSFVTITPNSPPSGGSFAVFPSTGVALTTKFNLLADNWEDKMENTPLSYAFYYYDNSTHSNPTLLIESNMHKFESYLPSGNLTIICEVVNRFGAKVKLETMIEVQETTSDSGVSLIYEANKAYTRTLDGYYLLYMSNVGLEEIGQDYFQKYISESNISMTSLIETISENTLSLWENIAQLPDTLNSVSSISNHLSGHLESMKSSNSIENSLKLAYSAISNTAYLGSFGYTIPSNIFRNLYQSIEKVAIFHKLRSNRSSETIKLGTSLNQYVLDTLETMGYAEAYQTVCGRNVYNQTSNQYSRFLFSAKIEPYLNPPNIVFSSEKYKYISTPNPHITIKEFKITSNCLVGWFGWTDIDSYLEESKVLSSSNPRNDSNFIEPLKKSPASRDLKYVLRIRATLDEFLEMPLCVYWNSTNLNHFENATCNAHYDAFLKQVSCECYDSGYVSIYAVDKYALPKLSHESSHFYYPPLLLGIFIPMLLSCFFIFFCIRIKKRKGKKSVELENGVVLTTFNSTVNEWTVDTSP